MDERGVEVSKALALLRAFHTGLRAGNDLDKLSEDELDLIGYIEDARRKQA